MLEQGFELQEFEQQDLDWVFEPQVLEREFEQQV